MPDLVPMLSGRPAVIARVRETQRGELTARILRCILDNPGMTAWEVSEHLYVTYPTVASRLHKLWVQHRVMRVRRTEGRGYRYTFRYYVSYFVRPSR